jgi:membrane-associated phospholipid phosphatase
MNLFNEIGGKGPFILSVLSIYLLWDRSNLLFYYLIGFVCDFILNLVLKGIIQQPRPCFNTREVQLALRNNKRYVEKDGILYDLYGMPSGHTESVLYSTVFVYLALRKTNCLYFYLLMCAITMCQRVVFKYHTIPQIIVGAPIGALLAYLIYTLAEKKLKGPIKMKPDDNGPI